MVKRYAIQRILERLGFIHVAGWVRAEDAKGILAKIKAAAPAVEAIKAERNKAGTVQTHLSRVQNDGKSND